MLASSKVPAIITLFATACAGKAPATAHTPLQAHSSVANSASNVQRESSVPAKRKVRAPLAGGSSAAAMQDVERAAETRVPTRAKVEPPQELSPGPTAHRLPAEFYGPQAEQIHTAYFCLDRVPNTGATQCYDDLMQCAEGREAFGLQALCEARSEVQCFYVIGDMWVVPFCYRTAAACRRVRKGLNGDFEKTPCAHTVRSTLSGHPTEASP